MAEVVDCLPQCGRLPSPVPVQQQRQVQQGHRDHEERDDQLQLPEWTVAAVRPRVPALVFFPPSHFLFPSACSNSTEYSVRS